MNDLFKTDESLKELLDALKVQSDDFLELIKNNPPTKTCIKFLTKILMLKTVPELIEISGTDKSPSNYPIHIQALARGLLKTRGTGDMKTLSWFYERAFEDTLGQGLNPVIDYHYEERTLEKLELPEIGSFEDEVVSEAQKKLKATPISLIQEASR